MARLACFLVLAVARVVAGGGYGNDVTEPPPPPPAPTYAPEEVEPAPTDAPYYVYDAPAMEPAAIEYPTYPEYPIDEPIIEPMTEAPATEAPAGTEAPMEIIDDMPLTEEITYAEPMEPEPTADGGYRRRFRKRKVKRTFALKRATESDLGLRFIKNCRDRNPKCDFWASLTAVRRNGRVVRVDECRTNPMMSSMEGCPRACDVCTPNIVEWKLRRRNARVLRRRRLARLAKKKNL
jgi:hypothetical protein